MTDTKPTLESREHKIERAIDKDTTRDLAVVQAEEKAA